MPKINANISCNFPSGVDLKELSSAIETAVSSVTGGDCRVFVARRSIGNSTSNAYSARIAATRGSIENMKMIGR